MQNDKLTELRAKRDELVRRLDDGAGKIERARLAGKDASSWVDYWIQLLRNYEKLCDEIVKIEKSIPTQAGAMPTFTKGEW